MRKLRWGVLGVSKFAITKVIPALKHCTTCEVVAIASRDGAKAEGAARELDIAKAYGNYEDLLADPDIDVVYNPLPNHMHIHWSVRAAAAGKHVLCEKPIALTAAEVEPLIAARDRAGVTIGEAFMVRTHPQWVRAIEIVRSGGIGQLCAASANFGYFNDDAANIRNIGVYGGGTMYDIGCYPIKAFRMMYGEEPSRVACTLRRHPTFGTDILTSACMEFPSGHAVFTCGTQVVPNQRMQFFGAKGRIEVQVPVNAVPGRVSRIFIDDGRDVLGSGIRTEEFPPCDQYTIEGDEFSRAVIERRPPPVPLEDAVNNMKVIDAMFRSAQSGKWENV